MSKKILIVDDSRTTRSFIKSILIENNYEVEETDNGLNAIFSINRQVPDAMIMDLLMPEMDGVEVLEKLQQHHISFPIIILSADIQEQVKEECFNLGAMAFLNKPISKDEIISTLNRLLA